ncbi:hypothetical protein D3C86_1839000 [compost metagenome]
MIVIYRLDQAGAKSRQFVFVEDPVIVVKSTVDIVSEPGAAPAGAKSFLRYFALIRQEVAEEVRMWPVALQRQFAAAPKRHQ